MNAPPPGSPNSFRSFRPLKIGRGHSRNASKESNASASSAASAASAPTPTMQALMQTIAQAPKGSKMAEDAAKALLVAEMARAKATGVPLEGTRPGPSSLPQSPAILSPTPSRPASRASHRSRGDSISSIGAAMLAPGPIATPIAEEEDPFEFSGLDISEDESVTEHIVSFNDLLGAPYDRLAFPPGWANAPPYPPPQIPLPPVPNEMPYGPRHPALRPTGSDVVLSPGLDRERTPVPDPRPPITSDLLRNRSQYLRPRQNAFVDVAAQQNAIGIFWRGDRPQQFSLVTEARGEQSTDDVFPVHVAPKNTQVVEIPRQWSGFVQKLTGAPGDPATRCEISFDGQAGMTFFGVTYAYGHNGGVVIRSSPHDVQAGSPFRAAQIASNEICRTDAGGTRVLLGTVQARQHQQAKLHKFYREFFETSEQGSILADDETNIVATRDRHLLLDFN